MKTPRLRFGIPSLDRFFGSVDAGKAFGIDIPSDGRRASTSICIIGQDGTGKSVLSLHMAAHYAWDTATLSKPLKGVVATKKYFKVPPRILYVSTDLNFEKARKVWDSFCLNKPWHRRLPFNGWRENQRVVSCNDQDIHVEDPPLQQEIRLTRLIPMEPAPVELDPDREDAPVVDYLKGRGKFGHGRATEIHVGFVDLARLTAGDDWSYVNRLLAMLQPPSDEQESHLLVIDAVEGLETLVGDVDAFGETRTRRSRIAQVMRAAADKCHVLFVVEEQQESLRHPEEFVTDAVIKLRSIPITTGAHTYSRRTLEVVKARAQTITRGEHPYVMRNGLGSYPGNPPTLADHKRTLPKQLADPNPDDPPVFLSAGNTPGEIERYCAYMLLHPSLSHANRVRAGGTFETGSAPLGAGIAIPGQVALPGGSPGVCRFGIPHLNEIFEYQGLKFGTVTALVGENGTWKSKIAMDFLGQVFHNEQNQVGAMIGLFTRKYLDKWLEPYKKTLHVPDKFVYRLLEIHDRAIPILFHMIQQTVETAKEKLRKLLQVDTLTPEQCGQIRMVIMSLTMMKEVFPEIQSNPLFLPSLVHYLRNEGVTALIVASQPGRPNSPQTSAFNQELRALVDTHVSAWHLPFFGEDKIVVSVTSPERDRTAVRELRRMKDRKLEEGIICDPHLEMYTGLDEGQTPCLVPIRVELIGQGKGFEDYRQEMNGLFRELLAHGRDVDVVKGLLFQEYENLRSFIYLQGDTRLNETLVFQVDEFWGGHVNSLAELHGYLGDVVCPDPWEQEINDPYGLFQPSRYSKRPKPRQLRRAISFKKNAREIIGFDVKNPGAKKVFRVPYYWDFGILACRQALWNNAKNEMVLLDLPAKDPEERMISVGDLLLEMGIFENAETEELAKATKKKQQVHETLIQTHQDVMQGYNRVTWRDFLGACVAVARWAARSNLPECIPFDLDMSGPETLSSLILEMWASEIQISEYIENRKPSSWARNQNVGNLLQYFPAEHDLNPKFSLVDLIEAYPEELFRVFLLLTDVLPASQVGLVDFHMAYRPPNPKAVAARHWYSTASVAMEHQDERNPLTCGPLPGGFTTRGDWFLAIAGGSRSSRLGYRALDLLSSRRGAVRRLQCGIGLPVRNFGKLGQEGSTWTKLFRLREGRRHAVEYRELISWGAEKQNQGRQWLWRSNFKDYHRHAPMFSKLIGRSLLVWRDIWSQDRNRLSAFYIYDSVLKDGLNKCNASTSFREFKRQILQQFNLNL